MKAQHTKEPWVSSAILNGGGEPTGSTEIMAEVDSDDEWFSIAEVYHEPNAKRLAACVNACAGIEDPERAIPALIEAAELLADADCSCDECLPSEQIPTASGSYTTETGPWVCDSCKARAALSLFTRNPR